MYCDYLFLQELTAKYCVCYSPNHSILRKRISPAIAPLVNAYAISELIALNDCPEVIFIIRPCLLLS